MNLTERSQRLTDALSGTPVVVDIVYRPIGREAASYRVRVTGFRQTASGAWVMSGKTVEGFRTFKVERILSVDIRDGIH